MSGSLNRSKNNRVKFHPKYKYRYNFVNELQNNIHIAITYLNTSSSWRLGRSVTFLT